MDLRSNVLRIGTLVLTGWLTACTVTAPTERAAPSPLSSRAQSSFESAVEAMQAERWQDAEILLEPLAVEYPQASGVGLNLGIVYFKTERAEASVARLRQAVASDPANPEAANWLGLVLREQGRFAEAETAYLDALKHNPDHAATHRNLGILYELYMGRPADALGHYQRYQALQGDAPDKQVAGWLIDLERRL